MHRRRKVDVATVLLYCTVLLTVLSVLNKLYTVLIILYNYYFDAVVPWILPCQIPSNRLNVTVTDSRSCTVPEGCPDKCFGGYCSASTLELPPANTYQIFRKFPWRLTSSPPGLSLMFKYSSMYSHHIYTDTHENRILRPQQPQKTRLTLTNEALWLIDWFYSQLEVEIKIAAAVV